MLPSGVMVSTGLTALGLWMTSLTYYSPYYTSAPFWHKSLGLVFAALLVLRLIWRAATPSPGHLASHQRRHTEKESRRRRWPSIPHPA